MQGPAREEDVFWIPTFGGDFWQPRWVWRRGGGSSLQPRPAASRSTEAAPIGSAGRRRRVVGGKGILARLRRSAQRYGQRHRLAEQLVGRLWPRKKGAAEAPRQARALQPFQQRLLARPRRTKKKGAAQRRRRSIQGEEKTRDTPAVRAKMRRGREPHSVAGPAWRRED